MKIKIKIFIMWCYSKHSYLFTIKLLETLHICLVSYVKTALSYFWAVYKMWCYIFVNKFSEKKFWLKWLKISCIFIRILFNDEKIRFNVCYCKWKKWNSIEKVSSTECTVSGMQFENILSDTYFLFYMPLTAKSIYFL